MELDQLANLAEILGGIAVISSLLFVGIQIRQNTRANYLASTHNLTNTFLTVAGKIGEDAEMARIWNLQSKDLKLLTAEDLHRLVPLNIMVLRIFEDVFHHHKAGQMDEDVWRGWSRFIATLCSYPGIQSIWQERRDFYSLPFQEFVEGLDADDIVVSRMSDYIEKVVGENSSA